MSDEKENTEILKENHIFFTTFEPKTVSRFLCRMTNKEGTPIIPAYLIKEMTRPSVIRKNGKWKWNPIQIKTYDPIVPSTTQLFYEYLMQDHPEKFDLTIEVFGPVGDSVERWKIKDAEISEVDFGCLNWCSHNPDGKTNKGSD